MKAFVTGGSGLIGIHLIQALLKEGYEVTCLLHGHTEVFDNLPINLVVADITDSASIAPYLKGVSVVFHLAAVISLDDNDAHKLHKINVEGTKAVASAAIHVYDYKDPEAILSEKNSFVTEKTKPCPDKYTFSKLEAHQHILSLIAEGFDATILVPTGVIGPHPTSGFMNAVIKEASKKKWVFLVKGGFNWVDARDVATAAISAVKNGKRRAYLIAGNFVTLKNIVKTIEKVLDRKIFSIAFPVWLIKCLLPILPKSQELNSHSLHFIGHAPKHISIKAAKKDLNYTPRSLLSTIKSMLLTPRQS